MTRDELLRNPFWVLGIDAQATRVEVERAGQKLLALLKIGAVAAQSYATPFGPQPRDEDAVRAALASLRDPGARVLAELWSRAQSSPREAAPAFENALKSIGWGAPCTGRRF